jgi:hypothetical protein
MSASRVLNVFSSKRFSKRYASRNLGQERELVDAFVTIGID